jgi:hypothetical protein
VAKKFADDLQKEVDARYAFYDAMSKDPVLHYPTEYENAPSLKKWRGVFRYRHQFSMVLRYKGESPTLG